MAKSSTRFTRCGKCWPATGLDIHALVDRIEHGGDEKLSAGEMQQIYDTGLCEGPCRRRRARPSQCGNRRRDADEHA